jgi:hypothetical protein
MGMSDCINCWGGNCCCGYEYRSYTPEKIDERIAMLLKVKEINKAYPNLTDQEFRDKLNKG